MDGGLESDGPSMTENGLGKGSAWGLKEFELGRNGGVGDEVHGLVFVPQKTSQDPSVGTGAAVAVTVGTGPMAPSVETGSQVSSHWVPASFLGAERTGCLPPYENGGLGSGGCPGAGHLVPSETLGPLPFPVTVADYISRAESQSRQRPPLERTKPSEDSLSGQKVGGRDVIQPTSFSLLGGHKEFAKEPLG